MKQWLLLYSSRYILPFGSCTENSCIRFKMSGTVYYGFFVAMLVVNFYITAAQMFCTKIDLNRTSFSQFRPCPNKLTNLFAIKDYNQNFKPGRPNSQQYMSHNFAHSCAELTPVCIQIPYHLTINFAKIFFNLTEISAQCQQYNRSFNFSKTS